MWRPGRFRSDLAHGRTVHRAGAPFLCPAPSYPYLFPASRFADRGFGSVPAFFPPARHAYGPSGPQFREADDNCRQLPSISSEELCPLSRGFGWSVMASWLSFGTATLVSSWPMILLRSPRCLLTSPDTEPGSLPTVQCCLMISPCSLLIRRRDCELAASQRCGISSRVYVITADSRATERSQARYAARRKS